RARRAEGLTVAGPCAQGSIRLAAPLDEVAARVPRALAAIGARRVGDDGDFCAVFARTEWSIASWGEDVSVRLRNVGDATEVSVTSRPTEANSELPAARSSGFDYGKGAKNVSELLRALQAPQCQSRAEPV
ncbi:MAG: hypothetical protein M3P96_05800, partial [Actinomycetota bacterium]|nr:hypothetical protein [Actinomycetota bacterium]